ncbi:glycosyltransferase family 39 protein [Candidatus Magnetominusculus xianensis]|uniref:Membrane protein n=1 Tax=Candidatus Magnetominusculus xianensis TaxID=1748249 RepID=A0ABR5SJF5_9BACT|nr:glycosyltransferase family 39 protein [Candidatus Magnetominusculus xianensis]KWT94616.1 putative membrane protein [Candidatus Magnetominusculus xianensis]MBF0403328.1 glycosyltransferase family 39 protein [Nitrospirota bacterium]
MAIDRKTVIILCLSIIVCAFFYLYKLDNRILWEDECVTANLAVNILKYGIPLGYDGKNRLIFTTNNDLNKNNVWIFSPWLNEYITAISFAILGKNEFSARLPFAVLGFLSVIFLTYLAWDIFKDKQIALMTLLLVMTSEVLILHSRQCRYYATVTFMQILFIYAFYLLLHRRRRPGIVLMVIALTCQFYSNYLFIPGNIILLLCAGFAFRKKYHGIFRDSIITTGIVSILAIIWVIYAQLWMQSMYVRSGSYYTSFIFYLLEINMSMFPLLMLLLIIFFHTSDYRFSNGISKDMIFFILGMIPLQLVFALSYSSTFLRYIIVLAPVFIILQALILRKTPGLIRYAVLTILCFTNFAGYFGLPLFNPVRATTPYFQIQKPRLTLKEMFLERITPYVNRSKDLIDFLSENTKPGQTLFLPTAGADFPVIFYTQLKVVNGAYDNPMSMEKPDWIFPLSVSGIDDPFLKSKKYSNTDKSIISDTKTFSMDMPGLADFLKQNYDMVEIEVHDTRGIGSVPQPDLYEYFTASGKMLFTAYRKKLL